MSDNDGRVTLQTFIREVRASDLDWTVSYACIIVVVFLNNDRFFPTPYLITNLKLIQRYITSAAETLSL
jgi:hypothetical protein